jgi:hypothetical protein
MASRRTISYIGLWALIMPWLGFSWGTKTILFSLTGILLLFIGNRHYNSENKKPKTPPVPDVEQDVIHATHKEPTSTPISTYKPVPEYMTTAYSVTPENKVEYIEPNPDFVFEQKPEPSVFYPTAKYTIETGDEVQIEKPKSRIRKKIEMAARPKRTSPKPITLDSLNFEYGEE